MSTVTRPVRGVALLGAALLVATASMAVAPRPVAASAGGCDTVALASTDPLAVEIEVGECGTAGDATYVVTAQLFERRTSGVMAHWSQAAGGIAVLVDTTLALPVGGWYDLVVTSQSDTGGQVVQEAAAVVGDGNRVTISAPVLQFRPGTMTAATYPATIDWSRLGDAAALRYKVQRSVNGGAFLPYGTATRTRFDTTVHRGDRYVFRVRGIGVNGVAGPWRSTEARIPMGLSDSSALVQYAGSWRVVQDGAYWGDRAHVTGRAGREVTLDVVGGGIAVVAATGPTRGSFRVYVDGAYRQTVRTVAAATHYRQVVYTIQWQSIGSHTIRLVVVGTDGHPRVDIDGFLLLSDLR